MHNLSYLLTFLIAIHEHLDTYPFSFNDTMSQSAEVLNISLLIMPNFLKSTWTDNLLYKFNFSYQIAIIFITVFYSCSVPEYGDLLENS